MDINNIVKILSTLGPARLADDYGDGCYDVAVEIVEGIEDVFYLEETDGQILWIDFSHATDLGPVDGSELVERLNNWESERKVA